MPTAKKNRYYSENDQVGVTRTQLKRLRKARQVEYLTFWFGTYYEDPVHRTSYMTSEGGYRRRAEGRPWAKEDLKRYRLS
jgi:hypothetical protein